MAHSETHNTTNLLNKKPIVAGNWKMHGSKTMVMDLVNQLQRSVSENTQLTDVEVLVCPPAIFIPTVAELISNSAIKFGAQDVSNAEEGAYTGQISAAMLKEHGCSYVIVGHSERRQYCNESNQLVAEKFLAAQKLGVQPILCVGETLEQREADQTAEIVLAQLNAVLELAEIEVFEQAIIAYEPIWAIGTGKTATPQQAQQVHELLRARLTELNNEVAAKARIIYGGSVNADNAQDLFKQTDIDGALVGGASLSADKFIKICCSF